MRVLVRSAISFIFSGLFAWLTVITIYYAFSNYIPYKPLFVGSSHQYDPRVIAILGALLLTLASLFKNKRSEMRSMLMLFSLGFVLSLILGFIHYAQTVNDIGLAGYTVVFLAVLIGGKIGHLFNCSNCFNHLNGINQCSNQNETKSE